MFLKTVQSYYFEKGLLVTYKGLSNIYLQSHSLMTDFLPISERNPEYVSQFIFIRMNTHK